MMQRITVLLLMIPLLGRAQDEPSSKQAPTFRAAITFHALSMPFHKPGNNFRNVGLKVGAELPWNTRDNLRQAVDVGYYFNRLNGRGLYIHSDLVYRPRVVRDLRLDLRFGPGLTYIFHPANSWTQKDGEWKAVRGGKLFAQGQLAMGLSYSNIHLGTTTASPFVQYEIVAIGGYNRGIPVIPNTMVHIGSNIKF